MVNINRFRRLARLSYTRCLGLILLWVFIQAMQIRADISVIAPRETLELDGTWQFATDPEQLGETEQWYLPGAKLPVMPRPGYADHADGDIQVPGCWDNQGYGTATEKLYHNFVGKAWYKRTIKVPDDWEGRRVFIYVGGVHRYAKTWVNGQFCGEHIGPVSDFEYDITAQVRAGQKAVIVMQVDSKQRWEIDPLYGTCDLADYMTVYWGGIWGHVRLEARGEAWLAEPFLWADLADSICRASVVLKGRSEAADSLELSVLDAEGRQVGQGRVPIWAGTDEKELRIEVKVKKVRPWSCEDPYLYRAQFRLRSGGKLVDGIEQRFGMREIKVDGCYILLNGKRLMLRGYGDDHIYLKETALPVDKAMYRRRLGMIKSYGFNHVRHHSTTMPGDYYDVCDELGIMPTAEGHIAYGQFYPAKEGSGGIGSNWRQFVPAGTDPQPALDTYLREWAAGIKRYRNHPCILAWVMGNEIGALPLAGDFQRIANELDGTRPFCDNDGQASLDPQGDRPTLDLLLKMFDVFANPIDLPEKFHTPQPTYKPVISHETGNYVTFARPDIIELFQHNFKPFWLTAGRDKLEQLGLLGEAERWAWSSERLYLLLHKINIESLRRNPSISGYHWWLFQDYWTTSNGIVDCYFRPKPGVSRAEVLQFNRDIVLLQEGLQYSYRGGEKAKLSLLVSNFSPEVLDGAELSWSVLMSGKAVEEGRVGEVCIGQGELGEAAKLICTLPEVDVPTDLVFTVTLTNDDQTYVNQWKARLFPARAVVADDTIPIYAQGDPLSWCEPFGAEAIPADPVLPCQAVYCCRFIDKRVLDAVEKGACLVKFGGIAPMLPAGSITFKTTWWKAPDCGNNCGTLVYDHSITKNLAPEGWCDASWFHLIQNGQQFMTKDMPVRPHVIIRALPSLAGVEDKAILFEVGIGKGSLIVSGLNHAAAAGRPENDVLLCQLLTYAATLPSPTEHWPIDFLRQQSGELPTDEPLVCGFSQLENATEKSRWHTYREDYAEVYLCRQMEAGNQVTWQTAAVPESWTKPNVSLIFAGGMGYASQPDVGSFTLQLNSKALLTFKLSTKSATWTSEDGRERLRFFSLRHTDQDVFGVFILEVPRELLPIGQAGTLSVTSQGTGSRRWFALHGYKDFSDILP
ncbi:MAG: hypothetical protein JXD22_05745 [Sedimentisphaerales bacterium]|nr:hypothetical protein [Sedimentisphaerales bacterium]